MPTNLSTLIDEARASLKEGVIDSLILVAQDVGGKTNRPMNGFAARFSSQKQYDDFMRTARMEYPGIDKYFQTKQMGGRKEVSLSPRDADRFER